MKTAFIATAIFYLSIFCIRADTIISFNFNSADGTNSTGTVLPAIGSGSAELVGGVTQGFVTGCSKDTSGDNSAWSISKFPAATTSNLQAGVQFTGSTAGFENIVVSWYQENSATASRYLRFQYTLDGVTFIDGDAIAVYKESTFTNKVVDLGAIAGAANNPNFGFRLVAEFESTASGSGTNTFVATKDGSNYGPSGTIHFDLVTISGTPIWDGNTPPYLLSSIGPQTVRPNQETGLLPFTVLDAEDPARTLTLGKGTSDPLVIPLTNIFFEGSNAYRSVRVKAGTKPGLATVTMSVFDSGGKSNSASFAVTVLPANQAPWISAIGWTNTLVNGTAGPVAFTVGDGETPAAGLEVTAVSANAALLPGSGVVFGGSGTNRTVTLTPAAGQVGVAPITVTVSDGTNSSSALFALLVTPSSAVLFLDPFDYSDGSVVTNSGLLWSNRSGNDGDCQVSGGRLGISADLSEDVVAPLVGGPYYPSNTANLYAAFKVTATELPKLVPDYFAHFGSGTTLRGRVHVGTTNAWTGFRFFVSNGDSTPVPYPVDMHTNETHTVVTRYNVATATTTLWVDPAAESDPGATATDTQSPYRASAFGFRQDAGLGGALLVDDVRVGLTFAAVLATDGSGLRPRLASERQGTKIVLRWSDAGFGLQAGPAAGGPFTNVVGASSPFTNAIGGGAKFFRLKSL